MRSNRLWTGRILFAVCILLVLSLLPHPRGQAAQIGLEDRFGYSGLETAAQKRAYVILEEHVGNAAESFVVDAAENISIDDMRAAAGALPLDRPDLFYFTDGNLKIFRFSDGELAVNPRYILHNKATPELPDEAFFTLAGQTVQQSTTAASSMTQGVEEDPGITLQEIRAAKAAYEAKIRSILQSIPAGAQTLQDKIKYLHDYLVLNITYQSSLNDQNAYSAIIEGKTVCAGYAKSYQDLLTRLGIKCWYITGFAREAHAWNVLWLNGECVYTDVTWADQGSYILNRYYNISKEQMARDHTMDPEYAAVLGSCNHEAHKHKMIPENVADSVVKINEFSFPGTGQSATLDYSHVDGAVSFYSSDPAVVTVTNDGEMTAIGAGTAMVTVILEDEGYAMQYSITVGAGQHRHSMEKVREVTPTCTEEGMQEYWRCTGCNGNFFDEQGSRGIADLQQLKIPAAEHVGGNWQHDATHHWKNCKGCNQLVAQSDASHADTDGNDQCDICGYGLPVPETTPTQPSEPTATEPPATEPTATEPTVTKPTVPTTPEQTDQTEATEPEASTAPQTSETEPSSSESTESGNAAILPTLETSQPGSKDKEKNPDTAMVVVVIGITLVAGVAVIRVTRRKK